MGVEFSIIILESTIYYFAWLVVSYMYLKYAHLKKK